MRIICREPQGLLLDPLIERDGVSSAKPLVMVTHAQSPVAIVSLLGADDRQDADGGIAEKQKPRLRPDLVF